MTNISQELLHVGFCNLVQVLWLICCFMWKRTSFLLYILPLISSFFFLSNLQISKISSLFSQGLRGTQSWNLVHTYIVGWCIRCTWIRLLVFIYFFSFLSLKFQNIKFFDPLFCEAYKDETWYIHGQRIDVLCTPIQAARMYLFLYFSSFFCLSNWQRLKTCIYKIVSTYLWWLRPGLCELCSLSAVFFLGLT